MSKSHSDRLKDQLRNRRKERLKSAKKRNMKINSRKVRKAMGQEPTFVDSIKPSDHNRHLQKGWKAKIEAEDPELIEEAEKEAKKEIAEARERERDRKKIKKIVVEETEKEENHAKIELARRELSRKYLMASVIRFNPNYLAGWVHKDICARLEKFMRDVEDGKSPRLMLQMPPRHGKSTLASQEFPAWVLGHHPEWEIISCSYAESLALDFSRIVRSRLREPEYHVLFPKTHIDRENQNAQGWKTSKRGGFLPAGVGGPITGKGAHILIIDDPVKNATEAESETTRESIWNWYVTTAYTRLAPGGGVLVI